MTTRCSYCGRNIDENNETNKGKKYLLCTRNCIFVPRGANSYSYNGKENYEKEVKKKMTKKEELVVLEDCPAPVEKKIKKVKVATSGEFKKGSKFVPCSVCGKQKFCRQDVYDARVAKFGSEKKMLSSYVCRDCKTKQKPVK